MRRASAKAFLVAEARPAPPSQDKTIGEFRGGQGPKRRIAIAGARHHSPPLTCTAPAVRRTPALPAGHRDGVAGGARGCRCREGKGRGGKDSEGLSSEAQRLR